MKNETTILFRVSTARRDPIHARSEGLSLSRGQVKRQPCYLTGAALQTRLKPRKVQIALQAGVPAAFLNHVQHFPCPETPVVGVPVSTPRNQRRIFATPLLIGLPAFLTPSFLAVKFSLGLKGFATTAANASVGSWDNFQYSLIQGTFSHAKLQFF
jgi:hypothetical protein